MRSDFVQYLSDRQLLSEELAGRIRVASATGRIPVGRLLLEAGVLKMREVMHVLALQGEMPGVRFGEIAMREGLVDTIQLEAALRKQATARKHQLEVVREMSLFSECELRELTMDYVTFLELRHSEAHGEAA